MSYQFIHFKFLYRIPRSLLLITIALLLFSCNTQREEEGGKVKYAVRRIVDGDTFYIEDGSKKGKSVRLIGVDTPETKHPRKPVEFYGKEASAYLSSLLEGKDVWLEFDVEKYDRYKRILAYVYLEDGTFVNAELVKNGYAQVATYPPNVKYTEVFIELQREARENNRGLWNAALID